jgi:hypothetical protein
MKTWVLIRSGTGDLFVIHREMFNTYSQFGMPYQDNDVVAESDSRDELVKFQKLTEES